MFLSTPLKVQVRGRFHKVFQTHLELAYLSHKIEFSFLIQTYSLLRNPNRKQTLCSYPQLIVGCWMLVDIPDVCPFAFSTRLISMTYSRNSFISSWKSLVAIVGKQVYASSENRKMHSLSTKQDSKEFFHKIP